jgi:hypothetical protein
MSASVLPSIVARPHASLLVLIIIDITVFRFDSFPKQANNYQLSSGCCCLRDRIDDEHHRDIHAIEQTNELPR